MKIVLDSTVLVSNFHMKGPSFRLLEWFITNREAVLVVPEIIIAEVRNKYRERLNEWFEKGRNELNRLGRHLGQDLNMPINSAELDGLAQRYNQNLERHLEALNAERPDHSDVPQQSIVERDLARRRPFRRTGKNQRHSTGYRDALLWEVILRTVAPVAQSVVLVTSNKKDFCDQNTDELHSDLVQDLIRNDLRGDCVSVCHSIDSFNEEFVKPEIPALEEARILLAEGRYHEFSVYDWINENISEIERHLDIEEYNPLEYYADFGAATIEWIEGVTDFLIDEVYELAENLVFVDVTFLASVSLDLFVYGYAYDNLVENLDLSVSDYDRHGAWLTGSVRLPIGVSLMFNISDRSVDELEARFLETFGWCRHCGEPYVSDAAETCLSCGR